MKKIISVSAVMMLLVLCSCRSLHERYMEQARNGDPRAQAALAESYLRGGISNIDYGQSLRWARQGVLQNNAAANYVLGTIYLHGYGTAPCDPDLAQSCFNNALAGIVAAADKGDVEANCCLGEMYLHGLAVKKDVVKALLLFKYSARFNYPPAMTAYALMLYKGIGAGRDVAEAVSLFSRAASANYPEAAYYLAQYYQNYPDRMSEAVRLYQQSADANYPPALFALGQLYESGRGVRLDQGKALSLYRSASLSGYAPAQYLLGNALFESKSKDAVFWWRESAIRRYAPALRTLGDCYFSGTALDQDKVSAINCYFLAGAEKRLTALDKELALAPFVRAALGNYNGDLSFIFATDEIRRIVSACEAGITAGGVKSLQQLCANHPENLLLRSDWARFIGMRSGGKFVSVIFESVTGEMRGDYSYLLSYAVCANKLGQTEMSLAALQRMEKLLADDGDLERRTLYDSLLALTKADAFFVGGDERKGYDYLFTHGKILNHAMVINYIKRWAPALLRDGKKFEVASGLKDVQFNIKIPQLPVKKDFYDLRTVKKAESSAPAVKVKVPEPTIL